MTRNAINDPPSPEDFQRHLAELMRQQFPQSGFAGTSKPSADGSEEEERKESEAEEFRFDKKPREVKAYLDRFVIRQDEAKKVLSVALCDHYHHVRLALRGEEQPNYAKQNIILIGPTGVGKTYLVRSIADLIGVPFVKGDATKFSETGYVGSDVEDLVRELLRHADGDAKRAEYGIIYIDEIDKIAAAANASGRDVSGRGVQTNLLKLMEETGVPARSPNDIAGQLQAIMDFSRRGAKPAETINTKHILFIVSGAFTGLEKYVRKRMREATIGFGARTPTVDSDADVMRQARTPDFIEYGFEPEFIGRLPVRVHCHPLVEDDLFTILKDSEGSIIRQYEQTFQAYGIEVLFQDDGLRGIAAMASEEQTGARGLMTVCERVFRDFKYELPSTHIRRFAVSRELVDAPPEALKDLLEKSVGEEQVLMRQLVHEFALRFRKDHGLELEFTDAAADRLGILAEESSQHVRDVCAERFKDFQFGLKLVSRNTGRKCFCIDTDAVEAPDKVLSGWVVASYRETGQPAKPGPEAEGKPGAAP